MRAAWLTDICQVPPGEIKHSQQQTFELCRASLPVLSLCPGSKCIQLPWFSDYFMAEVAGRSSRLPHGCHPFSISFSHPLGPSKGLKLLHPSSYFKIPLFSFSINLHPGSCLVKYIFPSGLRKTSVSPRQSTGEEAGTSSHYMGQEAPTLTSVVLSSKNLLCLTKQIHRDKQDYHTGKQQVLRLSQFILFHVFSCDLEKEKAERP